ncbi:unnamed protein product [Schistosoma turkestanicum]|nr:unnamed protein product [Schistosoma turkestanicum]
MSEIDIKIIKRTQNTLGKLIKRPVLTEKLLMRPPFRFIHDICTSLIRSTGLMKGLFSSEELDAENVKDKDKKLAFLQKLVDFLSVVHERTIPVRIMSIVAGKEADKTNEMLYLLAEAVKKKANNGEYVARVLQGRKLDDPKTNVVEIHVPEAKNSEIKSAKESNSVDHRKKASQNHRKYKLNEEKNSIVPGNLEKCDNLKENHLPQDSEIHAGDHCDSQTPQKPEEETVAPSLQNPEKSYSQSRHPRPASAKGQRVKRDVLTDAKLSTNQIDNRLESNTNSRLVLPRPRRSTDLGIEDNQKQMNTTCISGLIISDTQQDTTDEEDHDNNNDGAELISKETNGDPSAEILTDQWNKTESGDNNEHGGLVTKILQTKKEFENFSGMNKEYSKVQASELTDAAREREKALLRKDISRLCNSLQTLSRSAVPLSKLMDFVQEDLETMQQEFERWKNENHTLKTQLKQEENLTQSCIEPLKAQLEELEQYAKEKEKAIVKCKAKIIHNNERMQNLLFKSVGKSLMNIHSEQNKMMTKLRFSYEHSVYQSVTYSLQLYGYFLHTILTLIFFQNMSLKYLGLS